MGSRVDMPALWSAERFAGLAPWLALFALGLFILCRLARAFPTAGPRRPLKELVRREESGTAMLDFVLTFPFFTMVVLLVVQVALIINARVVVAYAAYTAARSAAVNVPEGEEDRVLRSAAIACSTISPNFFRVPTNVKIYLAVISDDTVGDIENFLTGLSTIPFAPLFLFSEPQRHLKRIGPKIGYSFLATNVEIETDEDEPRAPVTVTVTHRYYLSVPYAGNIFARALGDLAGYVVPVMPIKDSFTLIKEGKAEYRRQ